MTEQTQHSGDETTRVVREESQVEEVLSALKNERCREIISETDQEALSAKELADRCELPLSTVYRIVQRLVEIDVLEKRVRLSSYPQYTHEYALVAETVEISIGGDSVVSLAIARRSESQNGTDQASQQLSAD